MASAGEHTVPLLDRPPAEAAEAYATDGSLDFDGNPALKNRTGGWRACRSVLGTEFCYCLAFYGISYNLVTYLTGVLGQSNVAAARNVSTWQATCFLMPLGGAVVADSYCGRYRTMVVSCFIGVAMDKAAMKAAKKAEKADKALWDAYHTRIFCELCAKECEAGNRPGPFLSGKGYKNLGENWTNITKKTYSGLQFKNRWGSLKTLYCQWKQLQIDASGLGWNAKLGTIC